ncbi:MAG: hypothetical protein FWG12_05805 [Holophagaceae bacterium]|nr:hypothetical protein [Holophagaceae bacterium]
MKIPLFQKPVRLLGFVAAVQVLAVGLAFTGCHGNNESTPVYHSNASSVFVYNGNVYVAGNIWPLEEPAPGWVADSKRIIWKNGTILFQSNPQAYSSANSVFATDADVFFGGGEGLWAGLWKNNVPLLYEKPCSAFNSIFVSDGDVYAAGWLADRPHFPRTAMLVKNGEAQYFSESDKSTEANSVFVLNGSVCVAGNCGLAAVVWKDGAMEYLYLPDSAIGSATATSVYVSDDDVYVAGSIEGNAVLWKNGAKQSLASGNQSDAKSVFVFGTDVYVAGSIEGNAVLWKNGVKQELQ